MSLNIGKAAELISYVKGYVVQAASTNSAVISVVCKGSWSGRILVYRKNDVLHLKGTLAKKPGQIAEVFFKTETIITFVDVVYYIDKSILSNFKNMISTRCYTAPPVWHTNENVLVKCAVVLATKSLTPWPYYMRNRTGRWTVRLYDHPILHISLERNKVVIFNKLESHTFDLPSYTTLHLHRPNFIAGRNCATELLVWLSEKITSMK